MFVNPIVLCQHFLTFLQRFQRLVNHPEHVVVVFEDMAEMLFGFQKVFFGSGFVDVHIQIAQIKVQIAQNNVVAFVFGHLGFIKTD